MGPRRCSIFQWLADRLPLGRLNDKWTLDWKTRIFCCRASVVGYAMWVKANSPILHSVAAVANGPAVFKAFSFLSQLMIAAVAAFTLSAPGMAWNAHFLSHGADQIAADQHHHHDVDRIDIHDHADESSDDPDMSDSGVPANGHSHLPGTLAMMPFDLPGEMVTSAPPQGIEQFTVLEPDEPASTMGAPPAQPPRTA